MSEKKDFLNSLKRRYFWFAMIFVLFVTLLTIAEGVGMPKVWIGYIFLFLTIGLYSGIGIMCRTTNTDEYYVANRKVPAMFNGMATAADWMSAASFIGMAGTLYLTGFGGLAFILGWTGGYCLIALLIAPYLRKFGEFTIPDFLSARYGGDFVRFFAVVAVLICSFTYVVAQIYGVGLITTRLLPNVTFEVGVFLGLGGIIVCSFLGGMKAVTWTQVAQYIIIIVAYLVPVCWLSVKHTGIPIPQAIYGSVLQKVSALEKKIEQDPKEEEVRQIYKDNAAAYQEKIKKLPQSWEDEKALVEKKLTDLIDSGASPAEIRSAKTIVESYPKSASAAKEAWIKASSVKQSAMIHHAEPFPGKDQAESDKSKKNFIALMFCLMFGTAALPHVLTRFYTTTSVRAARYSVFWALFFISILYFTAPSLAVLAKYDLYSSLVGSQFYDLPAWITVWSKIDPGLLSVVDINKDGIIQLSEITISGDIIVLATPEMAGLPYVMTALIAAGGLAAALSTADSLLLTIASALSHDTYYKIINPNANDARRIGVSKIVLLVLSLAAAWVAIQRPADILFLVSAAFSLAAASFFPVLVLGIFWKRANKWGAISGMISGLSITFYYMAMTQPWLRGVFGVKSSIASNLWFDINPIAAGVFGLPLSVLMIIVVSLVTPKSAEKQRKMNINIRYPKIKNEMINLLISKDNNNNKKT